MRGITSLFVILVIKVIYAKTNIKIVLVAENNQPEASGWFGDALRDIELRYSSIEMSDDLIILDRANEEESYEKLCASVSQGVSLLLDLTWSEWILARKLMDKWRVPHIKSQAGSTILLLDAALDLLKARNASDALFIFETETDLDQALYNMIGKTQLRIMVVEGLSAEKAENIKEMRPIPGHFIIMGDTSFVQDIYKMAKKKGLVTLSDRWLLAFTDLNFIKFDTSVLEPSSTLLSISLATGCKLLDLDENCSVEKEFQMQFALVNKIVENIMMNLVEVSKNQSLEPIKVSCKIEDHNQIDTNSTVKEKLSELIEKSINYSTSILSWDSERMGLYMKGVYVVQVGNKTILEDVAKWSKGEPFKLIQGKVLKPTRTFYRIGTSIAIPWTYEKIDPVSGLPMKNLKGEPVYEGYCIDFIQKLSEVMNFDYEIVSPKFGTFGKKLPDGTWDGIVGDLVRGDTDMAVGATIMTSQREEVVDFVAPYFEQTGISIVIRKPMRQTSLFKFMSVLRVEVWLSIVAALALTAILLSLLDKYSPYSARNNKATYPYPCREFTLKESFWFALTSFTPQGGGEAPKALSGRTLVAAYWLFVVLMLATFTANLAAFLTVERMQTPVSSLEQLARQSRINYTVVEGQMAHNYFINMKNAEDTLYRVWKEITLNSSSDETIYQVWDYPIREQYGHILLAINTSNPVATAKDGFTKVNENLNTDFAFIHDSFEIKYEVSRNCNITEVGEVFGERPYAIAVQQGSRIQEDLSKAILELQKDRFFEVLTSKYWNSSAKGVCPDSDEAEGITLESLGGVFIATLFGLALAMITLVWEIIYYKKKEKRPAPKGSPKMKSTVEKLVAKKMRIKKPKNELTKSITIGDAFKPVRKNKIRVSYINVDPKIAWNP